MQINKKFAGLVVIVHYNILTDYVDLPELEIIPNVDGMKKKLLIRRKKSRVPIGTGGEEAIF